MISSECKIHVKNFFQLLSLLFAGAAGLTGLYRFTTEIQRVNAIFYDLTRKDGSYTPWWIFAAGALLALLFPLLKPAGFFPGVQKCEKICRPLLLLWFLPFDFPWILLAGFIFAAPVFIAFDNSKLTLPQIKPRWAAAGIIILTLGYVYWGYQLQNRAFNSLYFIYGDWNQYVDHYHCLLRGEGGFFQWLAGAGHWNFGVNCLMTLLLKYADAPDTVFLINALTIASAIPLSYLLMRKSGQGSFPGMLLALAVALNPALSHQYLAHFYGFHPIIFFIPVILGFFICREDKNRIGMGILFILSLLIQETVAIFWAGYAIYLFTRKKWLSASLLLLGSTIFFLVVSNIIIPRSAVMASAGSYAQNFHFAHLGNSMGEILLSPVTRPGTFWGTLFHSSTFSFLLAVIVPLAWAAVFAPRLLIAGIPLAAGICLQKNPEMKSVMLQYSVELTTLTIVTAVTALKNTDPARPARKTAVSGAILTATIFSLFLYGFIPGGKERASLIIDRKPADNLTAFIRNAAGEHTERMIATSRIRGFFQFEYPAFSINTPWQPGDLLVLDLHDNSVESEELISRIRYKILNDPRAVPVTYAVFENNTHVIFKILDHPVTPKPLPFLQLIPPEHFAAIGSEITGIPENYSIRITRNGMNNVCFFRLNKAVENDLELSFFIRGEDDSIKTVRVMFAHGLIPAYALPEGVVFNFTFESPPVKELKMNIRELPAY